MDTKNIVIGVLAVLTLFFGFAYFTPAASPAASLPTGAASGPSHFQVESFLQGLTGGSRDSFSVSNSGILSTGGTVLATTSQGTVTLTASNLINSGTIMYTPIASGGTLTLPTQASLAAVSSSFIPNAGDRTARYILTATTSATSVTTIAGNTGMILRFASTTPASNGSMIGPGTAKLEFWRSSTSTDIYVQAEFFK